MNFKINIIYNIIDYNCLVLYNNAQFPCGGVGANERMNVARLQVDYSCA